MICTNLKPIGENEKCACAILHHLEPETDCAFFVYSQKKTSLNSYNFCDELERREFIIYYGKQPQLPARRTVATVSVEIVTPRSAFLLVQALIHTFPNAKFTLSISTPNYSEILRYFPEVKTFAQRQVLKHFVRSP